MQQQRHCINLNYSIHGFKKEKKWKTRNKLLATKFIFPIDVARWLAPMLIT